MPNESILEVCNISKSFIKNNKQFKALDDITFQLHKGECLGIVGESGSGKSTLAQIITLLTKPNHGSVLLQGKNIIEANAKERRDVYSQIQMVFQNPIGSFDPRRTLGDGISESLKNRGFSTQHCRQTAIDLLNQCGLPIEFADRYPNEVSGGQCQRAAIARALAINPQILICDEATSALDVTIQKQILNLLNRLRTERNLSYIFICHNLALVQSFCDRVIVMQSGRIVELGTPNEIINHPKTDYCRQLIEAATL